MFSRSTYILIAIFLLTAGGLFALGKWNNRKLPSQPQVVAANPSVEQPQPDQEKGGEQTEDPVSDDESHTPPAAPDDVQVETGQAIDTPTTSGNEDTYVETPQLNAPWSGGPQMETAGPAVQPDTPAVDSPGTDPLQPDASPNDLAQPGTSPTEPSQSQAVQSDTQIETAQSDTQTETVQSDTQTETEQSDTQIVEPSLSDSGASSVDDAVGEEPELAPDMAMSLDPATAAAVNDDAASSADAAEELPSNRAQPQPVTPTPKVTEGTFVVHGKGAVQLTLPHGWQAGEVPFGREMRLVITAGPSRYRNGMPQDGTWVSYHVRMTSPEKLEAELESATASRLRAVVGETAQITSVRAIQLGGYPGFAADYTTSAGGSTVVQAGRHIIVQTEWGACEIHFTTPASEARHRITQFNRLLETLVFGNPPASETAQVDAARAAQPIFGRWKAESGTMRLHGDGRIVLAPDRLSDLSADVSDDVGGPPARSLRGRFQARDDLLLVQWDDGSLLNYRWLLRNESLLLTDHTGNTSLLRKIVE